MEQGDGVERKTNRAISDRSASVKSFFFDFTVDRTSDGRLAVSGVDAESITAGWSRCRCWRLRDAVCVLLECFDVA